MVLFRAHVLFICVPWSLSVGGMVCLWWSVPSVLPVDGEPVSLWDGLPVVSTLDTLPACEPVASGEGVPLSVPSVLGVGWMVCLWWSVPSVLGVGRMVCHSSRTHCQR